MTMFKLMAAAAAVAGVAAPVAAQVPYGYPQPTYPGQAYPNQYGYPNPGYPSQYGYPNQGTSVIGQVIDQLLGNRYNVTDRQAISQCANAAMIQAQTQYRGYSYGRSPYGYGQQGYGQQGYGQQGYGYQQGFAAPAMRVTAITDVQRRTSGLRVKGLMSSGYAGNPYGNQYGYNQNYAAGDLSFRCSVDYRGAVTNIRISANNSAYRRY
jgi:hypothetical protein